MGLKFFENNGGTKMYYCAACYVYLADKAALVSTTFRGVTGQAFLFKRVSNVSFGPLVVRQMMTGDHYVRDVFCGSCKEHLGWMYELAPKEDQTYKEGSVILERLHIIESEGITKVHQMDGRQPQRPLARRPAGAGAFEEIPEHDRRRQEFRQQMIAMHRRREIDAENRAFVFAENPLGPPIVEIFDEQHLRNEIGMGDLEIEALQRNCRQFNAAIRRSSQGVTQDLWELGFRADVGREYREIRIIMEGGEYRASREADAVLIALFDRMQREREMMDLQQFDIPPELNALMEENQAFINAQNLRIHRPGRGRGAVDFEEIEAAEEERQELIRRRDAEAARHMHHEQFLLFRQIQGQLANVRDEDQIHRMEVERIMEAQRIALREQHQREHGDDEEW